MGNKFDGRGSKAQREIFNMLCSMYPNYTIVYEQSIKSLGQRLDIFIKELGIAIEYDGEQHSKFIEHFHKDIVGFISSGKLDKKKEDFCEENGIIIIRIGPNEKIDKNYLMERIDNVVYPDIPFDINCLD